MVYRFMIWDDFKTVYDLLDDDLSKKIYEARVRWYFLGGEDPVQKILYDYYKQSEIVGLKSYSKETGYAICGAGHFGRLSLLALRHAGYRVCAFIDNDTTKQGTLIDGIKVYSFEDFVCDYYDSDVIVIIDNIKFADAFFCELSDLGWDQRKIFRTHWDIVRTCFGDIYFDPEIITHTPDEIFVDAGCFDGESTREFIKWCNGDYKKIYAIEPMTETFELSRRKLADVKKVIFKKAALGETKGEECFAVSYYGLMGGERASMGTVLKWWI